MLEGNGTSAIDPAESADVITLWTGTCNATTFLRADGSCQTIAGNTDASTLTTGTLADARLSSNVALENVANVFTAAQSITGGTAYALPTLLLDNSQPIQIWNESDQAADGKRWARLTNGGCVFEQLVNDANSSTTTWLSACRSGMTSSTVNVVGTNVQANGANILTTASTLNGSNVGTGTVADARLSANVALKNVADQTFSVVGNNSLSVANSSTGQSFISLATNGTTKSYLCTSTLANNCITGSAANDTSLRGSQKVRISADDGVSSAVQISNAQIDLNATAVNANGSRINTVANTGKVASARSNNIGAIQSGSINITSISQTTTGTYSVNLTAAGFSSVPTCIVSSSQNSTVGAATSISGPAYLTQVITAVPSTGIPQNDNFSIICNGQ